MGHSACSADVIEEKSIKKFCPKEFAALEAEIKDYEKEESWEVIAQGFSCGEERAGAELNEAYYNLCEAFEKKTGLELGVGYHNSDDGDIYDEVTEVYWYVNGMYQLTPAGKKMQKYVETQSFVTFG